jgi:hypothetical protein
MITLQDFFDATWSWNPIKRVKARLKFLPLVALIVAGMILLLNI